MYKHTKDLRARNILIIADLRDSTNVNRYEYKLFGI